MHRLCIEKFKKKHTKHTSPTLPVWYTTLEPEVVPLAQSLVAQNAAYRRQARVTVCDGFVAGILIGVVGEHRCAISFGDLSGCCIVHKRVCTKRRTPHSLLAEGETLRKE